MDYKETVIWTSILEFCFLQRIISETKFKDDIQETFLPLHVVDVNKSHSGI